MASDSQTCSLNQIKMNTAKGALDSAKKTFADSEKAYRTACLSPAEQARAAMATVADEINRANQEAEQLTFMHRFLLMQLKKEAESQQTTDNLKEIVGTESDRIQTEIDRLKSAIRTERRRFLDSDPSSPTSVTREPDNLVLIAFLACYGLFMLFAGLLVLQNLIPLTFFDRMTTTDRLKFVATLWVIAIVVAYIGLFLFT